MTSQDAYTLAGVIGLFAGLLLLSIGLAGGGASMVIIGAIAVPVGFACVCKGSSA